MPGRPSLISLTDPDPFTETNPNPWDDWRNPINKSELRKPAPLTIEVGGKEFHLGYSRIAKFLECAKQYKYTYVDHIRNTAAIPLRRGQAYHSTLETMFNHKLFNDNEELKLSTCEKLAVINSRKENLPERETCNVIDAIRFYHPMMYYKHTPICVEDSFTINRGGVKLTGRIDLINDMGRIIDHKFSYDTWAETRSRYGVQPMIYQWAGLDWLPGYLQRQHMDSVPYTGFQYNIMRLFPHPLIQVIDIPVIKQDMSDWWEEQIAEVAKGILSGAFPGNASDKSCQHCDHKKICKPAIYRIKSFNLGAQISDDEDY